MAKIEGSMRTGRVVVVTGAAGGIGALAVDRFLANGDTVIASDLGADRLITFARSRGDHARLLTAAADVASEADCAALATFASDRVGRVDVLINCAGYFPIKPFEQISAAEWRQVIDINLTGVFLVVQAILPLMKGRGWGRIINFGSGTFFKGTPNQSHYISAKAGVIGLSRCLATELGGENITVNVITPGLTLTEPVRRDFPKAFLAARRAERCLQRDQCPEDLIGAVAFLASPDADFMTGQIMNIDGGGIKH